MAAMCTWAAATLTDNPPWIDALIMFGVVAAAWPATALCGLIARRRRARRSNHD